MKMYQYDRCGTCVKAKKFLEAKKIKFTSIPVRETPPSLDELNIMLKSYEGQIKKLFNTSGKDYKEMGMKDKIKEMSEKELLSLLRKNGNLVKRPFVIKGKKGIVGFKEEEWKSFIY